MHFAHAVLVLSNDAVPAEDAEAGRRPQEQQREAEEGTSERAATSLPPLVHPPHL